MARTNNLSDFLTDVAGAIKEKTGDSTAIPASQFDTKIRSIETIGNYQQKTVNITSNGSRQIVPDTNYDALSEVDITVNVETPAPVLQNKTATQNGSYSADPGYDGLGTVLVNVQGQQINNQDKTITQNGQYTADSGYTGLGTVTVNVPSGSGDIKLFETEQVMQADPNPEEGDLAVVYRSEIQNWDGESEISSFYFPETVIFTTAIDGFWIFGDANGIMLNGSVSSSYANFRIENWHGGNSYEIAYTSLDGLTYTRTDSEGNPILLADDSVTFRLYEWDERAGNFMQVGGKTFEGLYEYKTAADENISCLGVRFSDLYPIYTEENTLYQYKSNLTNASLNLSRLNNDDISEYGTDGLIVFKIQTESELYYGETLYKPIEGYAPFTGTGVQIGWLIDDDTNTEYLIACITGSAVDKTFLHYTGSGYENITVLANEWQSIATYNTQGSTNVTFNYKILDTIDPTQWVATYGLSLFLQGSTGTDGPVIIIKATAGNTSTRTGCAVLPLYDTITRYFYAPTQLTLSSNNQLLPGITGYGKTGVITGDSSVYTNLNAKDYMTYMVGNLYGTTVMCYSERLKNKLKKSSLYSGVCIACRPTGNNYISGMRIDDFIVHLDKTNNKIEVYNKQTLNLISYITISGGSIVNLYYTKVGSNYKFLCFCSVNSSGRFKNFMGTINQNGIITLDATSSAYSQSTNFHGNQSVYLSNENRWYWSYNGTIYSCLHSDNSSRTTVGSGGITFAYKIINDAIYSTVISTTTPSGSDIYDNKIYKIYNNSVSIYLTNYGLTLNDGYAFQCVRGNTVNIYEFENATIGSNLGSFKTTSRTFPSDSLMSNNVNMYYDEINEKLIFVSPDIVVSNKNTDTYIDGGSIYELFRNMPTSNQYGYMTPVFNPTTHQLNSTGYMYDNEINIIVSFEHVIDDTGDIPVLVMDNDTGLLLNPYSIDNL